MDQKLKHGKLLTGKNFPRFVETFNDVVDKTTNIKGDYDIDARRGFISIDKTIQTHPVVRLMNVDELINPVLSAVGEIKISADSEFDNAQHTKSIEALSSDAGKELTLWQFDDGIASEMLSSDHILFRKQNGANGNYELRYATLSSVGEALSSINTHLSGDADWANITYSIERKQQTTPDPNTDYYQLYNFEKDENLSVEQEGDDILIRRDNKLEYLDAKRLSASNHTGDSNIESLSSKSIALVSADSEQPYYELYNFKDGDASSVSVTLKFDGAVSVNDISGLSGDFILRDNNEVKYKQLSLSVENPTPYVDVDSEKTSQKSIQHKTFVENDISSNVLELYKFHDLSANSAGLNAAFGFAGDALYRMKVDGNAPVLGYTPLSDFYDDGDHTAPVRIDEQVRTHSIARQHCSYPNQSLPYPINDMGVYALKGFYGEATVSANPASDKLLVRRMTTNGSLYDYELKYIELSDAMHPHVDSAGEHTKSIEYNLSSELALYNFDVGCYGFVNIDGSVSSLVANYYRNIGSWMSILALDTDKHIANFLVRKNVGCGKYELDYAAVHTYLPQFIGPDGNGYGKNNPGQKSLELNNWGTDDASELYWQLYNFDESTSDGVISIDKNTKQTPSDKLILVKDTASKTLKYVRLSAELSGGGGRPNVDTDGTSTRSIEYNDDDELELYKFDDSSFLTRSLVDFSLSSTESEYYHQKGYRPENSAVDDVGCSQFLARAISQVDGEPQLEYHLLDVKLPQFIGPDSNDYGAHNLGQKSIELHSYGAADAGELYWQLYNFDEPYAFNERGYDATEELTGATLVSWLAGCHGVHINAYQNSSEEVQWLEKQTTNGCGMNRLTYSHMYIVPPAFIRSDDDASTASNNNKTLEVVKDGCVDNCYWRLYHWGCDNGTLTVDLDDNIQATELNSRKVLMMSDDGTTLEYHPLHFTYDGSQYALTSDLTVIYDDLTEIYDGLEVLSGWCAELSGELSGQYWEQGGDSTTNYGSDIGNSGGSTVIDLDGQELAGCWKTSDFTVDYTLNVGCTANVGTLVASDIIGCTGTFASLQTGNFTLGSTSLSETQLQQLLALI